MDPDVTLTPPRVEEIVAQYLAARADGETPTAEEFLARYPQHRAVLREFFANETFLQRPETSTETPRGANASPTNADVLSRAGVTEFPGVQLSSLERIGDYEILGELARGGMGIVYRARQVRLNRTVALKMILSGPLASPTAIQRFRYEAEAAASLNHPNIVPVYEVGNHQQIHYYSMKLIECSGRSLSDFCLANAPDAMGSETAVSHMPRLTPKEALSRQQRLAGFMAEAARAVQYAHEHGIIHRDLKPSNILVDHTGAPQLTDFGLAKRVEPGKELTATGEVVGTPAYMAPEQAAGNSRAISTKTDVYGLGAVLYYLLTGRPPIDADNTLEILLRVASQEPTSPRQQNPLVDADLEAICLKCLEKVPERRYESAAALATDLEHWRFGQPISLRPPSLSLQVWIWLRKNVHAALWVVMIAILCSLAGSFFVGVLTVGSMLERIHAGYSAISDDALPLLARLPGVNIFLTVRSSWLVVPVFVIACIAALGMGFFVHLAVGACDIMTDVASGLAAGAIAGAVAFVLCIGPSAIFLFVVQHHSQDLADLSWGCFAPEGAKDAGNTKQAAAESVLTRHPRLRALPESTRAPAFANRMVGGMALGIFASTWIAAFVCVGCCIFFGVQQTVTAGLLARRYHHPFQGLLQYFEVSALCVLVVLPVLFFESMRFSHFLLEKYWDERIGLAYGAYLLFVVPFIAFAYWGLLGARWASFRVRAAVYAMNLLVWHDFFSAKGKVDEYLDYLLYAMIVWGLGTTGWHYWRDRTATRKTSVRAATTSS